MNREKNLSIFKVRLHDVKQDIRPKAEHWMNAGEVTVSRSPTVHPGDGKLSLIYIRYVRHLNQYANSSARFRYRETSRWKTMLFQELGECISIPFCR